MKVTLELELNDDQAKAVTFAEEIKGPRSAVFQGGLKVMDDPRKIHPKRDVVQTVLTHMVDTAIGQCVGVMRKGIQIYEHEQAVIRDVNRKK